VTIELTRKDRMAKNIKRMKEKYQTDDFDFIPESFVLPDMWESFFDAFVRQRKKILKI
jgi:tubulin polyglutamylase TTLL5